MSDEVVIIGGAAGPSFLCLLQILLIGLKITGYITAGWGIVLMPLWLPAAIFLGIPLMGLMIFGSILGITKLWSKWKR